MNRPFAFRYFRNTSSLAYDLHKLTNLTTSNGRQLAHNVCTGNPEKTLFDSLLIHGRKQHWFPVPHTLRQNCLCQAASPITPTLVTKTNSKCSRLDSRNSNRHQTPEHGSLFFLRGKCEELQKSARMTSTLQLNPGTSWHAQHLVESLVRGCTSWSKTIATPLIPAVKVRAKALSMGSFPKSAPMFHWLFAWATFTNRSKPSFTGCLAPKGEWNILCFATQVQTYLQHGGPSTYNGMIRHACSTAMLLKQA